MGMDWCIQCSDSHLAADRDDFRSMNVHSSGVASRFPHASAVFRLKLRSFSFQSEGQANTSVASIALLLEHQDPPSRLLSQSLQMNSVRPISWQRSTRICSSTDLTIEFGCRLGKNLRLPRPRNQPAQDGIVGAAASRQCAPAQHGTAGGAASRRCAPRRRRRAHSGEDR